MQYKPQYRTLIKLQEVFAVTKSPNYEPTGLVPLSLSLHTPSQNTNSVLFVQEDKEGLCWTPAPPLPSPSAIYGPGLQEGKKRGWIVHNHRT